MASGTTSSKSVLYNFDHLNPFVMEVADVYSPDGNGMIFLKDVFAVGGAKVPEGHYYHVYKHSYLKTQPKVQQASSLSSRYFELFIHHKDTRAIMGDYVDVTEVQLYPIGLAASAQDYEKLQNKEALSNEDLGRIVKEAHLLKLPELAYTECLRVMLPILLGRKFEYQTCGSLLTHEVQRACVCRFGTSRPDGAFYHCELFSQSTNDLLVGALVNSIEDNPESAESISDSDTDDDEPRPQEEANLTGCVTEDKLTDRSLSQLIAGMILLSTSLGIRAITRGDSVAVCIILGGHRVINRSTVTPVKLTMSLVKGTTTIDVGEQQCEIAAFLKRVKDILEDPYGQNLVSL